VVTSRTKTKGLKTHYALLLTRSVRHMGESVWQPLCGLTGIGKITMTTVLHKITCLNCRNYLTKHRRRLGISKQINKILREGVWHDFQ
jgi:hypothetical protein